MNPRVLETRVYDASNLRKTRLSYVQQHGVWLMQHKDEYAGWQGGVYRRTVMEYTHYPSRRIIGLPLRSRSTLEKGASLLSASRTHTTKRGRLHRFK
ncbi:MAG: hypothetical protein KIT57_05015 [Blastocatellales bacterium]|nr:hypothetical protein [Blastocatellales bacterium]